MSKKLKALIIGFSLFFVTACSGGAESSGSGAISTSEIVALSEDVPPGLDSDGPSASIPVTQMAIGNIMEPLVYYKDGAANATGVGLFDFNEFEGRLAESFTYDEATLTWTFKLRQGVVGCNDETFNADDVLYTFARAKSVSGSAPIGWFLSNVADIANFTAGVFDADAAVATAAKELGDEVTKVDDYTVTIKQAKPNKLLLPVLTIFGLNIFDKEGMEANATPEDPWAHEYSNNTNLPSFGAYCIDNWVKSDSMTLVANENYYAGAPSIKKVVWRKVPTSANRLAAVQTGQAQIVDKLTPSEFASLDGVEGVGVSAVTGNQNLFVHMNFLTKPFDNVLVRRAISSAIDYDKIIANGYFGKAQKWDSHMPSTYPGYKKADSPYTYDPEAAKALLAEAGYVDDGSLKLTYITELESTLGPIATQIRADLAAVGINIELDPIPQSQFGDRALVKRDLPFALNDNEKPIAVDSGYATLLFFVSAANGSLNNMVNYESTTVDDLYVQLKNEGDNTKRDALLAQVQETLMTDVTWVPVVEYQTQWAHSDKLSGIKWHPDNGIRFKDLSVASN
jgi:peptide/nickel transport system substrate-binding protein